MKTNLTQNENFYTNYFQPANLWRPAYPVVAMATFCKHFDDLMQCNSTILDEHPLDTKTRIQRLMKVLVHNLH